MARVGEDLGGTAVLYAGGLLGAVLVLGWLFCIIDVIMTPEGECRYLPKLLWLGIVVLLADLGALLWLLAGRPWPNGPPLERLLGAGGSRDHGRWERSAPAYPEYDRPGRFAATNPDDDDAFLRQVRERAEAQRRGEAAQRRERDQADLAEREQRQQARHEGDQQPGDQQPDDQQREDQRSGDQGRGGDGRGQRGDDPKST